MPAIENKDIARVLDEIGDMLEIESDANTFRVRAYRFAAQNVEGYPTPIADFDEARLREALGIGADMAAKIFGYIKTGEIPPHAELLNKLGPGLLELRRVHGLGPKRIRQLAEIAKIRDKHDLRRAIESGAVRTIPGFGPKTEERILRALDRMQNQS